MSVQTERGSSQRGASSLVKIRESAEQLLVAINQAIEELPNDLEKQMDRIKAALLTGYAEEGIRDLGKTNSNGNSASRSRKHEGSGFMCDKCDREFKNEAGLRIHYGRTHKRRRKPATAGAATPTSSNGDASGVEFSDPDA